MSTTPPIAQTAANFVASLGVDTHINYAGTAYSNLAVVESDLAYIGVSNVRDMIPAYDGSNASLYASMVAHGISFDFSIPQDANLTAFIAAADKFVTAYPGKLASIAGANEVNFWPVNYKGLTGMAAASALQKDLYAAVKADPLLKNIPVYNVTLGGGSQAQYAQLGNLSAYTDDGNVHLYPQGSDPTPYNYLAANIPWQTTVISPSVPTVITEAGFFTMLSGYGVNTDVQAKYTLDMVLDASLLGVKMDYLYELMDERPDTSNTDSEQHYGLFYNDGSAKPAATALHNLTTIIADGGDTAATRPGVGYTIANQPSRVHSMELTKASGATDIAVWAEPVIWNGSTYTESTAPVTNVTVTLDGTYKSVSIYDPMKGTSAIQTLSNVGSVNLALTDHPLIIEVSPNAVTPPPPPPPPPVTSPNDTVVLAGSTAGITDASGNVWTITGGGQVAVNGTVDAITSGVVKLAYVNGTIWQQTASGLWWGETQPNDSWGPQAGTMTSPLPVTASPNSTVVVANSTAGITDASGNVWTITSGSQVAVNGVVDAITSGVVELAYVNGKIWQQTSGKLWWGETQPNDAWASQAGTATSPLPLTWPVVGAGSDTLVLKVSEDTYLGDAQFTVSVDGKQLGGTLTASASHAAGAAGTFTVKGDWAVGNHTVAVQFLNDAYGGTAATDRNLYVTGATYDGASTGASLTLMSAGAQSFSVKDTTPIVVNVPSTQASTTIAVSNATINASGGDHIFFISGHGDTFNLGGGVETITDSGSGGNIFNLPATGSGSAVFNAAVLTDGDVFGLKAALAATQWTGTSNTLGSFLHTLQSGANTQLLVSAAPTSAATGTLLATFNSSNLSLSTILAHSLTT